MQCVTAGRDLGKIFGQKRVLRHGKAAGVRMISGTAFSTHKTAVRGHLTVSIVDWCAERVYRFIVEHARRQQLTVTSCLQHYGSQIVTEPVLLL